MLIVACVLASAFMSGLVSAAEPAGPNPYEAAIHISSKIGSRPATGKGSAAPTTTSQAGSATRGSM